MLFFNHRYVQGGENISNIVKIMGVDSKMVVLKRDTSMVEIFEDTEDFRRMPISVKEEHWTTKRSKTNLDIFHFHELYIKLSALRVLHDLDPDFLCFWCVRAL